MLSLLAEHQDLLDVADWAAQKQYSDILRGMSALLEVLFSLSYYIYLELLIYMLSSDVVSKITQRNIEMPEMLRSRIEFFGFRSTVSLY